LEFFLKHKTVILRSLGALMLLVGFVIYFWAIPKEGISENELAAANVARLEAQASGSSSSKASAKKSNPQYLEKLKKTRAKQLRYLVITMMVFGVGFLAYSFVKKEEPEV
jgi:hypothetical protein